MKFKDRIKNLRFEKNMTQAQLASFAGKGEGAVRAWESGKAKPDVDTLIKLSEYFNCTTDYLLGLSEFKNSEYEEQMTEMVNKVLAGIAELSTTDKNNIIQMISYMLQSSELFKKLEGLKEDYLFNLSLIIKDFLVASMLLSDFDAFSKVADNESEEALKRQALSNAFLIFMNTKSTSISHFTNFWDVLEKELNTQYTIPNVKYKNMLEFLETYVPIVDTDSKK